MKIEDIIINLNYIQESERKYGRIWTVCEESVKALEKQIPKQVKGLETGLWRCPICPANVNEGECYCSICGQRLNWN